MLRLLRTDSQHADFIYLVARLDAILAELDGDEHAFYNSLNKIDNLKQVIIAYEDNRPVGCGAIRVYDANTMEIKRMYTLEGYRGRGIGTKILAELEKWAAELDCSKCVLETGKRQPDAIALYMKRGYSLIPNYGKYLNIDNSVCFEKELK